MIIFRNAGVPDRAFALARTPHRIRRIPIRGRARVKTRGTIPFIVRVARVFGIHRKIAREISFETEAGLRAD